MKYLFILITFCLAPALISQTVNGIVPSNFKAKIPACRTLVNMPKVDNVIEANKADRLNTELQDKVYRFGKEIEVAIDFIESSEIFVLPNGNIIRQLSISSKGAVSLNFIFDQFYLAEGALLFITNESKDFIGAYTSLNNNDAGVLGSEILKSDKVTLVLEEDFKNLGKSQLKIGTVVHGYRDIDEMAKGLNTSGDCNVDVNCPAGAGWENQRNSVAMMVNGGGFCTGALVHNTSGNIIPYFLTARHCGSNPTNWVFRFRWESPSGQTVCAGTNNSGNGPQNLNVNGATLKASNVTSDFSLVLLNNKPDSLWGIFYSGWDHSDGLTVTSATGIHHPDGDIKKISKENQSLNQQTIQFNGGQNRTWQVADWDLGVTEPGSSGSPLFDQNRRVIGVLSGGGAACNGTNDNGQADYFGRFGYAWNNGATASERLKDWLDPANTGLTFINGIDPLTGIDTLDCALTNLSNLEPTICNNQINPEFKLENLGSLTITSAIIEYGIDGSYGQSINWTGSIGTFSAALISVNLTVPSSGLHIFNARIVQVNTYNDQQASNNLIQSSFNFIQPDFYAKLRLELDCYASETSWLLRDNNSNVLYKSVPYSDDNADTIELEFCLSYGCYSFQIKDSYGDGMSGCSLIKGGNGYYTLTNQSNNSLLATISESNADFGASNTQAFCYDGISGLSDVSSSRQSIRVSPNPGRAVVHLQSEGAIMERIKIVDLFGKLVFETAVDDVQIIIPTEQLNSGMYLIYIETKFGETVERWVKN
ncbi:MAG: T9SS type A sorting domain-containing protein [Bacteroidetes bacterium]|nr:T9SS type A sorting domain-containing protein [Bacteroidota bacterium]